MLHRLVRRQTVGHVDRTERFGCRVVLVDGRGLRVDLAAAPPSNSFLTLEQLDLPEVYYPLKLYVCDKCWLVQVDAYQDAHEIFSGDYAYFSSYSKSWLSHAKEYASMAVKRFNLDSSSRVVEIASNDGYLLQYFMDKAIPCLGIEPTACTAEVARKKGIGVVEDFFGRELAEKLVNQGQAQLVYLQTRHRS